MIKIQMKHSMIYSFFLNVLIYNHLKKLITFHFKPQYNYCIITSNISTCTNLLTINNGLYHDARCMFHAFNIFQMLDLSYNNLSQDDLLTLGTLPNLKILHLTGNNFHTIPMDFALPYVDRETLVFIL